MEDNKAKLKAYSVILSIFLGLFVLLLLAAKFLVGVAGHTKGFDIKELLLFIYIIVTIFSLITYINKDVPPKPLKYLNIILVSISGATALYIFFKLMTNDSFLFLPVIALTFFIGICFFTDLFDL